MTLSNQSANCFTRKSISSIFRICSSVNCNHGLPVKWQLKRDLEKAYGLQAYTEAVNIEHGLIGKQKSKTDVSYWTTSLKLRGTWWCVQHPSRPLHMRKQIFSAKTFWFSCLVRFLSLSLASAQFKHFWNLILIGNGYSLHCVKVNSKPVAEPFVFAERAPVLANQVSVYCLKPLSVAIITYTEPLLIKTWLLGDIKRQISSHWHFDFVSLSYFDILRDMSYVVTVSAISDGSMLFQRKNNTVFLQTKFG